MMGKFLNLKQLRAKQKLVSGSLQKSQNVSIIMVKVIQKPFNTVCAQLN